MLQMRNRYPRIPFKTLSVRPTTFGGDEQKFELEQENERFVVGGIRILRGLALPLDTRD